MQRPCARGCLTAYMHVNVWAASWRHKVCDRKWSVVGQKVMSALHSKFKVTIDNVLLPRGFGSSLYLAECMYLG
jgi:hypothetical protein